MASLSNTSPANTSQTEVPVAPDAKMARDISQRPAIAAALRWFGRERAWINERHLDLCRIPAPTFFERSRAEWLRDQLAGIGWNASLDRVGNVLATFGEAPRIATVVSAHLDTVFAPQRPEDVSFSSDGRLIGPGASDNGSGLSALLALAKAVVFEEALAKLAGSLLLVANVGEEGEGNLSGMRYLCENLESSDQFTPAARLSGFLVLDGPSLDHVTIQALASQRYEIIYSGPGGHSWNDYGTPNPVHALADAISLFAQNADSVIASQRRGSCSYNFGVIEGGSSVNSIPASARAKLDIRSENSAALAELSALVQPALERALERANRSSRNARLTARVRDLGARPGGRLPMDSELLHAVRSVDAHLNIRSRVDCASTDANVPLSMGLPALSIGTGGSGGGAHTNSEWYQPEGRELGLRRVFLIAAALHELQLKAQTGAA